jgi:hypothetical protein
VVMRHDDFSTTQAYYGAKKQAQSTAERMFRRRKRLKRSARKIGRRGATKNSPIEKRSIPMSHGAGRRRRGAALGYWLRNSKALPPLGRAGYSLFSEHRDSGEISLLSGSNRMSAGQLGSLTKMSI